MEENLVICKICGFKANRIYGQHLKSHGMTSDDYKKMFPGEPLYSQSDTKNTSKNSGKHMKEEKYKKMFADKIKGEKNPNHKTNTTLEQRQKISPFSKKFINYNTEVEREEFIKKVSGKKSYNTRFEYWINKGYSEEEAKVKLKERQKTFTLDSCIKKYGEKDGQDIYDNRQQRWQKSLTENGNLKCGFSKISQDLFYDIIKYYKYEDLKKVYFATKNQEYFICKGKGEFYQYDFVDLPNKKIIEYNGDEYHANPEMFEADEYPHPFRKTITAQEIWNKDERKLQVAEEEGFEILTIWDLEYRRHKEETLERCKNFLNL